MCPGYNKQGFYFLSCQPWQAGAVCQSQTRIFPSHITWPVRKILQAKICPQLHSCKLVTSVVCPQWHQSKSLLCKGTLQLQEKDVRDSEETGVCSPYIAFWLIDFINLLGKKQQQQNKNKQQTNKHKKTHINTESSCFIL